MSEAIFARDGDRFVPSDLARGPWTPQAQHGGAPAALLAHLIERFEGGEVMFVARLTIELLRPVPIAPLAPRTRLLRPGRKVQLVEASPLADDVEVARCTALRIRRAPTPLPDELLRSPMPAGPANGLDTMPPWTAAIAYRGFHNAAVEHRFVTGTFAEPGPA